MDVVESTFALPGLTSPGEILIDKWGVPHIYAASAYDAFRAQGFNAARERLWQIDFWRRRGLGLLSEVFGAEHVERDRAARLLLFRGDTHADWLAYGSDTKRVATEFVGGINAYVQMTRDNPDMLPVEFRELGYLPAFWEPGDVTRIRSHGLFYNIRDEVARAVMLRDLPPDVEELRKRREPDRNIEIPEGLDLSSIPDDVLSVYNLGTSAPVLSAPVPQSAQGDVLPEGSNNWVVGGSKTVTGRPILANDPHRAAGTLPGLRYIAHLSAPGMDVIGGGEPALPGISIGHNGNIAFGLTIFSVDQEDLYVYETNPDNPAEYRFDGRWEPMRIIHEVIPLADGSTRSVELRFTRHGPVIHEDAPNHRSFALRAAWLEPGLAPYLGSMDYMRAETYDAFLAAMNRWGAPPENQVFADPSGNFGWKPGALTPKRPNWDGVLPVPGDGRYEWDGFYDMDELPILLNPDCGYVASANEMNLPPDFPADRHISYDWYGPARKQRLDEVLGAANDVSVEEMMRLQSDFVSVPATRILARIATLPLSPELDGLSLLLGWDADLRPDSAAAALYEVWHRRHFRPALLRRALTSIVGDTDAAALVARVSPAEDLVADARIDLDLIETPGDRLGANPDAVLAELVQKTLPPAIAEVESLLGKDRAAWRWGRLHVAKMAHPLATLLPNVPEDQMVVGPLPRGGSGDTVGNTAYGPNFVQSAGSTFRIVIDVGDWDKSLAMNAPGQSGRLGDPHSTDLFPLWARGEAFPLLYSRERIEESARQRITLTPL